MEQISTSWPGYIYITYTYTFIHKYTQTHFIFVYRSLTNKVV